MLPPKIILCGNSGVGKTALAMTLGPGTILFDLERGSIVGQRLIDRHTALRQAVEVIPVLDDDPKDFKVYENLFEHLVRLHKAKLDSRRAVVIDGLSAMTDACLGKYSHGDKLTQQTYNTGFNDLLMCINLLLALRCPVVLIAHTQRDFLPRYRGDKEPDQFIELGVPGKNFPNKIMAKFNECWYMETCPAPGGKLVRRVLTCPSDRVTCAKTQLQLPNETDVDCGMLGLFALIGYEWGKEVT